MKKRCIIVSGPIGSGKSLLLERLQGHNYQVLKADEINHHILITDKMIKENIIQRWGQSMYSGDNPDKVKIAEVVFNHQEERQWLEKRLHPKIYSFMAEWVAKHEASAIEIPLIYDAKKVIWEHETWVVLASKKLRLERTLLRSPCTKQQVLRRMQAQPKDDSYRNIADHVIMNDSSVEVFYQAIECCLKE
ncbi:MAG TPA: dephospho-CoA kinase [Gammaproteobacteria bacterium]|nr:dephospho-CoA kinase [Gammaproteobacteria bacterium]